MVKKFTSVFIVLIILCGSPEYFSQKASNLKPTSSGKEKVVYYNEPSINKAEISRRYISELSPDKKRINIYEENSWEENRGKKSFINYTSYSHNYFKIDDTKNSLWDGKHWSFNDYPLKIYVKKSKSEYFKDKYINYIDYAIEIWKSADKRLTFEYSATPLDADIIFSFENNLMDKYEENYLGLTDYEVGNDKKIIRSFVEISLLKYDNRRISDGEIKSTIIHELGHALGLGHSSNHYDLMYPYIKEDSSSRLSYTELSTGDIEAIRSVVDLGEYDYSFR